MRTGLIISSFAHVAVLTWGMFAMPAPARLEAPDIDALPIEIVPFEELSQKRAGDLKAKPETPPPVKPEPVPPKPVKTDKPVEKPQDQPAPKVVEATPPPAPAPPAPEPDPVAEPVEPEPAPPEPVETKQPEVEPEPAKQLAKAPPPRKKPKPPAQPTPPKQEDFSSDKIAALLNKQKPQGAAPEPVQQQLGVQGGDNSNQLSQNEIDFLRRQLESCWSLQAGMEAAESIAVQVQMVLNIDGSLAGAPRVMNSGPGLSFQIAAERALRAVQACAPYSYMPQEKYDTWSVIEFNFDPSKMFQG
uniref:cell envelope biogenesis protein TolA n=1 Tax=Pararhizobium sp. IMCC3301 TaxID=3067904 RepID=UPI002740AE2B|nr:cell envelope biogenesis protein TolA [Pararhizobium sp. IMCC3301]